MNAQSHAGTRHGVPLIAVAVLFLGAGSASAAGINLGWNDCPGGASYALAKGFACDSNTEFHTMVVSYVAPANVLALSGNEIVIDVQTEGTTMLPWWSLRSATPAGCRSNSMVQSTDFLNGPFTCYDYWQGNANGSVSMDPPTGSFTRIKALALLPGGSPLITSVPEGTHVYSIKIRINSAKTVGPGSCAGCTGEACFVLNYVRLNQPVGPPADGVSFVLTNEATTKFVVWQGWTLLPGSPCPYTGTRVQTWGSIKALYR